MSDALATQYCDNHCCNALCHLAMALDDCEYLKPECDLKADEVKKCCDDMHKAIRAAIDATLACYDECCK